MEAFWAGEYKRKGTRVRMNIVHAENWVLRMSARNKVGLVDQTR